MGCHVVPFSNGPLHGWGGGANDWECGGKERSSVSMHESRGARFRDQLGAQLKKERKKNEDEARVEGRQASRQGAERERDRRRE